MYREWKEIEFPKWDYIWIWEQQVWEEDQEIEGKMRWERMEEQLVEKGGRKKCVTERNGRSSWEWQRIATFRTWQWNEQIFYWCVFFLVYYTNLNIPSVHGYGMCFGELLRHGWRQMHHNVTYVHTEWYPDWPAAGLPLISASHLHSA